MSSFNERWQKRRSEFLQKLAQSLADVDTLLDHLAEHPDDEAVLKQIYDFFHKVAGSGGIYELSDLCAAAIAAEEISIRVRRTSAAITRQDLDQLRSKLQAMETARQLACAAVSG